MKPLRRLIPLGQKSLGRAKDRNALIEKMQRRVALNNQPMRIGRWNGYSLTQTKQWRISSEWNDYDCYFLCVGRCAAAGGTIAMPDWN